jgi:hypothetical protein
MWGGGCAELAAALLCGFSTMIPRSFFAGKLCVRANKSESGPLFQAATARTPTHAYSDRRRQPPDELLVGVWYAVWINRTRARSPPIPPLPDKSDLLSPAESRHGDK